MKIMSGCMTGWSICCHNATSAETMLHPDLCSVHLLTQGGNAMVEELYGPVVQELQSTVHEPVAAFVAYLVN